MNNFRGKSHEQQMAEEIFGFALDPLGFVLYNFPWGEPGTPLERFPLGPDKWALKALEDLRIHLAENERRRLSGEPLQSYQGGAGSGHGIGKSAFVAWIIMFFMSTRRDTRGVVTANTGSQLENKTWPELAKWHNMALNKHWFKWTATKFFCQLEEGGEANWKVDAVTWSLENTEAFAGLHNASGIVFAIFDEASAVPDKIWEVQEGAFTDGEAFWFAFGNRTRNTGRFHQCWGKFRHRWKMQTVDSREVRITNKEKIAQWAEDYGEESDFFKVRVRGMAPASGELQFISTEVAEDAQKRDTPMYDPGAPLIMGVDVARKGGDKFVIRFRHGKDARSIKPIKFPRILTDQAVQRVIEAIIKYNPDAVNIDSGGGGAQIHDMLASMGYRTNLAHFGAKEPHDSDCANARARMWREMRDWLQHEGAIDDDEELFDDLIGPEYGYDNSHRYLLESKESMNTRGLASPDDGDALACTFWKKIARSDLRTAKKNLLGRGRVARGLDYDVI